VHCPATELVVQVPDRQTVRDIRRNMEARRVDTHSRQRAHPAVDTDQFGGALVVVVQARQVRPTPTLRAVLVVRQGLRWRRAAVAAEQVAQRRERLGPTVRLPQDEGAMVAVAVPATRLERAERAVTVASEVAEVAVVAVSLVVSVVEVVAAK